MFSSAFSRIGDARPATRFPYSNMVALSGSSVRDPDQEPGWSRRMELKHPDPSIPISYWYHLEDPQYNYSLQGPEPASGRYGHWKDVPWPRRLQQGPNSNHDHIKHYVSMDMNPRFQKQGPTMPYRNYATRNNGPKKNSSRGSRTKASRPHRACRRHRNHANHRRVPIPKPTTIGDTRIDDLSTSEFVELILKELDLKTLPNNINPPKDGWDIRDRNSRRRATEYMARRRLQGAADQQAAKIFETAGENVFKHLKKTTSFAKALQFKIRISRIIDDLESQRNVPKSGSRSRNNRRRAYAMMADSQPQDDPSPAQEEPTGGSNPVPGPNPDPGLPVPDPAAGETNPDPHTSNPTSEPTEPEAQPSVKTVTPEDHPESPVAGRTNDEDITTAIKNLQEQMDKQGHVIHDLMMNLFSPGYDSHPSSPDRDRPGSHLKPQSSRGQRRNITERRHHHNEHSTLGFGPLSYEESDQGTQNDSDVSEHDLESVSGSEASYSSSYSDDLSMPTLQNMLPMAPSPLTMPQSPAAGPSIQAFNENLEKLKTIHKKLRKRAHKKKHRRKTETIFRYLMKAVESYQLPVLDYKPEPARRRGAFLRFLDKLKLVTSSVYETQSMLEDIGQPQRPKTAPASKAMFRVLCARLDPYLVSQLQELQSRIKGEDGHAALLLLRALFADAENQEYKDAVMNQFKSVRLQDGESIFGFTKRFGFLYRAVIGSGQSVKEPDRVRYYLTALKRYKEPRILYEVKGYEQRLKERKPVVLQEIQQELIQEEEQIKGISSGNFFDATRVVRHGPTRRRSTRHANASDSRRTLNHNPSRNGQECWGCKQTDHILRNCPTTSEQDKKRLYEMRRVGGKPDHKRIAASSRAAPLPNQIRNTRPSGQLPSPKGSNGNKKKAVSFKNPEVTQSRSYAQVASSRDSRAQATASAARRVAFANLANSDSERQPPREMDLPDPYDIHPPEIGTDNVQPNPDSKTVFYEEAVLLDSGASDCMVWSFAFLDLIRTAYVTVCLADGTVHDCNYQGLMRISATDIETNRRTVVPMTDTLLVPGLRTILWSVPALSRQGHQVIFGLSTVSVVLHANTQRELTIRLRHPMLTHNGQTSLPFSPSFTGAAFTQQHEPRIRTAVYGVSAGPRVYQQHLPPTNEERGQPEVIDLTLNDSDSDSDETMDDLPPLMERPEDDSSSDDESSTGENTTLHPANLRRNALRGYDRYVDQFEEEEDIGELPFEYFLSFPGNEGGMTETETEPEPSPEDSDDESMGHFVPDPQLPEPYEDPREPDGSADKENGAGERGSPSLDDGYETDADVRASRPSTGPLSDISLQRMDYQYRNPPRINPVSIVPPELPHDFFPPHAKCLESKRYELSRASSSGELRRRYGNLAVTFAMMAQNQLDEEGKVEFERIQRRRQMMDSRRPVSLELMHRRFGHRSTKSILLGEASGLYTDLKVTPESDEFCETCKISTIRAANKGHEKEEDPSLNRPGKVFYLDMQSNPAKQSLSPSTYYPYYLMICCAYSRYFKLGNLKDYSASQVIGALEDFQSSNRPFESYSFKEHCEEIHVDAGSQFVSEAFRQWCTDNNIHLIIAAPAHQEMNGLVERMWQSCRKTAFGMCNNARLGWPFLHYALHYATDVMEVLPIKGCVKTDEDGKTNPSCPHSLYFIEDPDVLIALYRVFGCPCVAKVYVRSTKKDPKTKKGTALDSKNIIQRGVRGIFVGFPKDQAGWAIYIPSSGKTLASVDIAFDENFTSEGIAYNKLLFHDSRPVRGQGKGYLDDSRTFAFTGPPNFFEHSKIDYEGDEDEVPIIYEDEVPFVDEFQAAGPDPLEPDEVVYERQQNRSKGQVSGYTAEEEEQRAKVSAEVERLLEEFDAEDESEQDVFLEMSQELDPESSLGSNSKEGLEIPSETDEPEQDGNDTPDEAVVKEPSPKRRRRRNSPMPITRPRRSTRLRSKAGCGWSLSSANAATRSAQQDLGVSAESGIYEEILMDTDEDIDSPGSDPTPFMPTPRSITEVYRLPTAVRRAWTKAFVKEIKGILIDRQACVVEDPNPDDKIIPIMDIHKAKLDKDGLLERIKTRCVFRGDLFSPKADMDAWNPHASFLALKVMLATCARLGIFPSQTDFVQAYLQADMRERVFVRFPEAWKYHLPEHLHKWIGRPLRLRKGLYGYNYSGKFLYEDQAEFLRSEGLEESGLPGLWIKHLENGGTLLFLHYVDDILSACTDERTHREFLAAMGRRFDIETRPRADWYLQTRIQQDKDRNITLDQTRYSKSMIQRFLPNLYEQAVTPKDVRKYAAPLTMDVTLSMDDCSKEQSEVDSLEKEYGFRFIEVVGAFNWLSYTCYEEIFAIRKLCRFISKPGRPHFQAALHLLHHFRCHPPRPLIYYHKLEDAPITKMLKEVPEFQDFDPVFVMFADSAHADSDQGRSTACDLQVFQGGLIDHNSWLPHPVPMSTAESENNCYSAGIMRMRYTKKAICKILFMEPDAPLTVPVCVDSSAAIAMNTASNPSRKTRHVESRYWYTKSSIREGHVALVKVDGKTQQPADIGTKNQRDRESQYYRYLFEAPYYTE